MKKLFLLLTLAAAATVAVAQRNNDEIQTIFSRNRNNGAYGAFSLGYSQINGRDALVAGARGAFIFDRCLALGLGGYGFVNDVDNHQVHNELPLNLSLAGGYGGIVVEPILAPKLPVHLSFPILLGAGGVALIENSGWWRDDYYEWGHDLFWVVEPMAELEFNLTRFLRLAAYTSYRFTSRIDLENIDSNVLREPQIGLTVKLGKF